MPLKAGKSKKVVSQNIREFHTGKTYAATKAKFGKAKADKQAVAVALSNARKYAKGGTTLSVLDGSKYASGGLIRSIVPGRTDKIPMNVRSGSYILPADIPSALGQGNTEAGAQILSKMFKMGPYGSGMTGAIPHARPPHMARMNLGYQRMPGMMHMLRMPRLAQKGGEQTENSEDVPIIAAGGEMEIPPEVVKQVGHGNMTAGHRVLDKFVLKVRKHHIETLKKLKPPKQ